MLTRLLPIFLRNRVLALFAAILTVSSVAVAQDVLISPGTVDFGSQPQGSGGVSWTLTVNNTSSNTIALGTISLSDATDFSQSNSCGASLSPYSNCTVRVTFAPTTSGAITGQLLIPNSSLTSAQTVALTGSGIAGSGSTSTPNPVLAPGNIDFGSQTLYTTSSVMTATLNNQGAGELDIASITTSDPADFTVSSDCGSVVSPYSSCHVSVSFAPSTIGPISASILVKDNATGGIQTLALTGTGAAVVTSVSVSPIAIDFGTQPTGAAGNPWTVTVNNQGANAISLSSFAVSQPAVFQLSPSCGATLAAHSNCNISVSFAAGTTGATDDQLTFLANGVRQIVPLHGTGTASLATQSAAIMFSPSSVDFGSLAGGSKSGTWTISVNNTTPVAATFSQVLSLAGSSAFVMTTDCTTSLAPHANCNMYVTFAPTANGPYTAQITGLLQGSTTPQIVTLTGTGIVTTPVVLISPGNIDFGSYDIGNTSGTWTVNIANTTGSDITFNSPITVAGSNAFTMSSSCGTTLTKYSSCNITLGYAPNALGPVTGQVVVDVAGGSVQTLALKGTGTGTAPTPPITITPTALTFPTVPMGVSTPAQTVTLTNTSSAAVTFSSPIALSGAKTYALSQSTCGPILAAAATCTVSVTFTPTDQVAYTGEVIVNATGYSQPITAALDGAGAPPLKLAITPATYDFGTLTTGAQGTTTITVTNNDTITIPLGTSALNLVGSTSATGSIANANTCDMSSLAPGASCTIELDVTSTQVETLSGSLVVNPAGGTPISMTFTAAVAAPKQMVSFSPATYDFGSVTAYSGNHTKTVQLTNTGKTPVSFYADPTFKTSDPAAAFAWYNWCVNTPTLAPGQSCNIDVQAFAQGAGTYTALMTMTPASGPPVTMTFSITGVTPLISLAPAALSFGSQTIGKATAAQTVVISNSGTVPANAIVAAPANADYAISANTCTSALPVGGTCSVSFIYTPSTAGPSTDSALVSLDGSNTTYPIALSGTGTAPAPTISFTPGSYDFGTVAVNSAQLVASVTVTNTGTGGITLQTPTIVSSDPVNAVFTVNNPCALRVLPPGAPCVLTVSVSVVGTGQFTGTLSVTPNNGSATTMKLTVAGTSPPSITLTPSTLNFGSQNLGGTSAPQTFVISNTSTIPVHTGVGFITSTDYYISASNCLPAIPVGGTCSVSFNYAPSTKGASTATALVTLTESGATYPITLTGTGTVVVPTISVTPAAGLVFPATAIGHTSAALAYTITNTGTVAAQPTGGFIGTNTAFTVISSTCPIYLQPTVSCTVQMTYTARNSTDSATYGVTELISGKAITFPVSGTGTVAPILVVNPPTLNFGPIQTGMISGTRMGVYNPSSIPVNFALQLTDPSYTAYSECTSATVAPGSTCVIDVYFQPVTSGTLTASLTIQESSYTTGAAGAATVVTLTGSNPTTLNPTSITVSPNAVIFGLTPVTWSAGEWVQVNNISTHVVDFTPYIGVGNRNFGIQQNNCSYLLPKTSCWMMVTFQPQQNGVLTDYLRIVPTDGSAPAVVSVSGLGGAITNAATSFNMLVNPTSLNLVAGQSGTASFTVFPNVGYKGTITLGCAGLPAGVTCTFVPPTLTADGSGNTLSSTLTVTTTASGSHAMLETNGKGIQFAALGLLPGLLLLGVAGARKRFRNRLLPLAMLLLAAGFTTGITGCGAGPSVSGVTPIGAHTLTITATAAADGTGATEAQTASFTVNVTN